MRVPSTSPTPHVVDEVAPVVDEAAPIAEIVYPDHEGGGEST